MQQRDERALFHGPKELHRNGRSCKETHLHGTRQLERVSSSPATHSGKRDRQEGLPTNKEGSAPGSSEQAPGAMPKGSGVFRQEVSLRWRSGGH